MTHKSRVIILPLFRVLGAPGRSKPQRQLAKEVEEAARRLEQLTREQQQRQNLNDAARQLQDAANAMKQAAANGNRETSPRFRFERRANSNLKHVPLRNALNIFIALK